MTREEALKILNKENNHECTWSEYCEAYNMAIKALEQEPRKGHWKTVPYEQTLYCSECNLRLDDEQTYIPLHYCPNCGCAMVEPQERNDKE